jgi:hypothetical protein
MRKVGQPDPSPSRRLTPVEIAAVDYYRWTADKDRALCAAGETYYLERLEEYARRICELTETMYLGIAEDS